MRIAIFALAFAILLTSGISAAGLEINEIKASVEYDESLVYSSESRYLKDRVSFNTIPVANNSRINVDVFPGSNLTLTVRVENTLAGNNNEISDIIVTGTIKEVDDGSDLEQKSLDFELGPGDEGKADIKFAIPVDVARKTYDVVIEAHGDGKNFTSYSTQLPLKLEVKKLGHDIRITKTILNPGAVDCKRKSRLTAEIMNAGSTSESNVALEFKAAGLGINSYSKDIVLEASDDIDSDERKFTKSLDIELPEFFNSGTYPIYVSLYWQNYVLFDQKIVNIVVRDCASAPAGKPGPKGQEIKNKTAGGTEGGEKANGSPYPETQPSEGRLVLDFSSILLLLLAGFIMTAAIGLILFSHRK